MSVLRSLLVCVDIRVGVWWSRGVCIVAAGLRLDGRRPADLRRFTAKIGLYEGADGSAYVEHGNTKVLAVVYGPSEVSVAPQVLAQVVYHDALGARPLDPILPA